MFYFGSSQLFPVSISVPNPPVGSFVVIDFGPATLGPALLVGEVPPNHSPDRYLQQGLCPVSCKVFTARQLCRWSEPGAGVLIQLLQRVEDVQLHGCKAVQAFTLCDKPRDGAVEIASAVSPLPGSVGKLYRAAIHQGVEGRGQC